MRLNNIKFERNTFFNYCGDFNFELETPILEPDSTAADFKVANLIIYPYISSKNVTIAFNDLFINISPNRFFSHVHLCRILYESVEIAHDGSDYIFHVTNFAAGTPISHIKDIILTAGKSQLFEKKILEQYFDLFCISQSS